MTLVVTHAKVSGKPAGNDPNRVYGTHWDANHALTGAADATQLNSSVVQAVTNDTNITGSISAQNLTLGFTGTLAAARLNANVVQAVTNDTNVTGSISAQNLTFAWSGTLAVTRGGTGLGTATLGDIHYGSAANTLSALAGNTTSTKKFLTQTGTGTVSAAPGWGTIAAADVPASALTAVNDTNVTLTLGGTPASSLLAATSITVSWTGTLAASRGGFGADVSAQSGVPLFATGVATFTGTTGSGNFARATSPTFVTPVLGTPTSGTLTNCTGLPLTGLATEAANTLVGNVTGSSASPTAFTIDGLTLKASPASTDEVIIWDVAGSAIKKATVSGIGASAGVSSIASNTGAFTLSTGITNSVNDIRLSLTNATIQATPSNPTGTTSTTGVMMGLGSTCKLTPVYSGRVLATFTGVLNSTGGNSSNAKFYYGTGTAPINGAAFTGTNVGPIATIAGAGTTNLNSMFTLSVIITGLTPGTAYWFDLDVFTSNAANTASVSNLGFNAMEF